MFPHEYPAESDKHAPCADTGGVRSVAAAPVVAESQRRTYGEAEGVGRMRRVEAVHVALSLEKVKPLRKHVFVPARAQACEILLREIGKLVADHYREHARQRDGYGLLRPQPYEKEHQHSCVQGYPQVPARKALPNEVRGRTVQGVDRERGGLVGLLEGLEESVHFCSASHNMSLSFAIPSPVAEDMNTQGTLRGRWGRISFSMSLSMRSHLVIASTLCLVSSSGL